MDSYTVCTVDPATFGPEYVSVRKFMFKRLFNIDSSDVKVKYCRECDKQYSGNRRKHICTIIEPVMAVEEATQDSPVEPLEIDPAFDDNKKFTCEYCQKNLSTRRALRNHMIKIHKVSPTDPRFTKKQKTISNDGTICELCGLVFRSVSSAYVHQRTIHYQEEQVECLICSKVFRNKGYLTVHHAAVHENQKTKCNYCNWETNWKRLLKGHIRRMHPEILNK